MTSPRWLSPTARGGAAPSIGTIWPVCPRRSCSSTGNIWPRSAAIWRARSARSRPQAADAAAVDTLSAHLEARAEWIPNYRARRRQRRSIGNGLGEKANDRIVVRWQKRRGMQWGAETSDSLAALRTLVLNEGWDDYWQRHQLLHLDAA